MIHKIHIYICICLHTNFPQCETFQRYCQKGMTSMGAPPEFEIVDDFTDNMFRN